VDVLGSHGVDFCIARCLVKEIRIVEMVVIITYVSFYGKLGVVSSGLCLSFFQPIGSFFFGSDISTVSVVTV
jgi:hypothetical protein